jgi:hypothetical protein
MAALQLHIDRLVLHGFSPLDAQRVRDAFANTLAAATPSTARLGAASGGQRDRLRLAVPHTGSPEALGRAAALALLAGSLT